jgi:hypothetical protein
MSAGGVVKIFLNDGTIDRLKLVDTSRGQNQGSKRDNLQSYKGLGQFKRIIKPINKSVWGPTSWMWLHNLALSYPTTPTESEINDTKLIVIQFINNLPLRVPCKAISMNYIKNNPISLQSNADFQIWVWKYHNSINYRIGKKYFTLLEYDRKYKTNFSGLIENYA